MHLYTVGGSISINDKEKYIYLYEWRMKRGETWIHHKYFKDFYKNSERIFKNKICFNYYKTNAIASILCIFLVSRYFILFIYKIYLLSSVTHFLTLFSYNFFNSNSQASHQKIRINIQYGWLMQLLSFNVWKQRSAVKGGGGNYVCNCQK